MVPGGLRIRVEPVRMRWRKRYWWLANGSLRLLMTWGCYELECWYTRGRGAYPRYLWRTDFPGREPVTFPLVATAMKKRTASSSLPAGDAPKHLAPILTKSLAQFPNLVMFCSVVRYDDGDARLAGWIQLRTDGSAWKVILKDPDTCSQMTCLGNTVDDALALAELYAGADDAPWEPDPWAKRKKTGKSQ